jgi:hypothetical protein
LVRPGIKRTVNITFQVLKISSLDIKLEAILHVNLRFYTRKLRHFSLRLVIDKLDAALVYQKWLLSIFSDFKLATPSFRTASLKFGENYDTFYRWR